MPSKSPAKPPSRPSLGSSSSSSSSLLLLASVLLSATLLARPVRANADKIIFTGPPPVGIDVPLTAATTSSGSSSSSSSSDSISDSSSLSDLNLIVLLPDARPSLRTIITRVFPLKHAEPAWFLLSDLAEGRRYELRVCWSALEPTTFTLDVFSPAVVSQTPALIQSLSEYAAKRRSLKEQSSSSSSSWHADSTQHIGHNISAMLLRVNAVADYFSHHKTLMADPPPPVLVDLILDPYVYNAVPRSLLPTAAYLVGVGVMAWFLAQWIAGSLVSLAGSGGNDQEKKKQS